jgi:hypothetical protein
MIELIPTKIENGRAIEMEDKAVKVEPIRMIRKIKALQNKQGSQVFTSYKIMLELETVISESYKIRDQGKKWEILSLYKPTDAEGNIHHIEVLI